MENAVNSFCNGFPLLTLKESTFKQLCKRTNEVKNACNDQVLKPLDQCPLKLLILQPKLLSFSYFQSWWSTSISRHCFCFINFEIFKSLLLIHLLLAGSWNIWCLSAKKLNKSTAKILPEEKHPQKIQS